MPSGLPPADWLLGRNAQLAELVDHLTSDEPAPVPILGGPGMGKTALSVHAFRHPAVAARYGARRYFVRCDGVTSADALPGAILSAMGQRPSGDPRVAALQALAADPALLVLDNFETPWDADRPAVESSLSDVAATAGLSLVVSSRGSLRPPGVRWRSTFEISRLDPANARCLLLRVTDGLHRDDADLEALIGLLDGVPLAIRLMGHYAAGQPSIEWVLEAWSTKRTAILKRDEGRENDLEVSIGLSLDGPRLDEHGRRLAAALALLPSGMAFDDLEALFPDQGREAAGQLVVAGLAFYGEDRLLMLAPVREAVARVAPAVAAASQAIATHYLELLTTRGADIGRAGGREAIVRLEPELGNFESAFRRLLADPEPDAAFRGRRAYELLLRFTGLGSPRLLVAAAQRARELERVAEEAACMKSLGHIELDRSDHESAYGRYDEALPLYRQVGDVLGEASCMEKLGDIALRRSDHESARALYDEALPLFRKESSVLGEANCIARLGDLALLRSDHESARALYDEALPLYRQVGDVLGEAICIARLGEIAQDCSDHESARARYDQALSLFRKVGSVLGEANCIRRLGDLALRRSDHESAQALYNEALPLFRKVGSTLGEANCIRSLGDIGRSEKDLEVARDRWLEALELYEGLPEPYSIGWTHRQLAQIADGDDRARHLKQARQAWLSIDRRDLIEQLDDEFGGD